MRRPLLLVAAVTAAVLLLAACGDDDTTSTGNDSGHMDMGSTTMGMGHGGENSAVADDARRVEVAATSFSFDPDQIDVTAGEDIAIVLTSDDIQHDFTIDELDAHVVAGAGETTEGGFRADEPGRYTFYCAVEGHRDAGMEGTLVVE